MEDKIMEMKSFEIGQGAVDNGGEKKTLANRDDEDMAFYGKKQQLKRNFGFLSIAGFVGSLLCTWEGLFTTFLYGFQNGGPAGLVYGFLFCWVGTLAVGASMGELASMMPLAGGQYHWVAILAPPNWAKFLSYITGWLTVIGWQAAQASTSFLAASVIQGIIVLNNDAYSPTRWQATLLLYGVILVIVFINTYLARWLPKIEGLILCLHIIGFFAILIPLVYLAPHGSPKDVFATFVNGGGWSSDTLSFFIGIITSVYSFIGADSACHMAEEIHNASTVIPWVMICTIVLNGVLGLSLLVALLFCLGDINTALTSATGFPFIEIFAQGTGSIGGATGMTSIILVLLVCASVSILATASRMLWSFSRDKGLPGSSYLSRVHQPTALPLYSILVSSIVSILLGLVNIGSTAAFNAIMSVTVAAFFSSYLIPISLILFKRLRKDPIKDNIRWGAWNMGPLVGPVVNVVAIIYTIITFIFSFFPTTVKVTPVSNNWSSVIFGGTIIFSIIFYQFVGQDTYKCPIVKNRHQKTTTN